jgi:hypothetical protein
MSTIGIGMIVAMLILLIVSLWAVISEWNTPRAVNIRSYKNVSILNEYYKNDGERVDQKQLLENTDYVLNAMCQNGE